MLRDDPQGLDFYRQPKALGLTAAGKGTYVCIYDVRESVCVCDWVSKGRRKHVFVCELGCVYVWVRECACV